jgi:hypothetical protein
VSGELVPPKAEVRQGVDYQGNTLELIREIRPRLDQRYHDLPDADLVIRGIVLAARKP